MVLRITIFIVAALLFMSHDYWFEARPFVLSAGEEAELHLWVGDDGHVELERTLEKGMTPSFRMYHGEEVVDLLASGKEGDRPVAKVRLTEPGHYLVVMERDFAYISLTRQEFLDYLKHEGIADDKRLLDHMGGREKQRERYARSVKALLYVRDGKGMPPTPSGPWRRVYGHPYEIVLLNDPYALRGGGKLHVKVLRHGLPVAGKKVMAQHLPEEDFREIVAVSDREGSATFDLPEGGMWLVRSLDLNPCHHCDTIDWESHWASFSFFVPL